MKRILFTLIALISITVNAQYYWQSGKLGNSFDGFQRIAYNFDQDEVGYFLNVINRWESVLIDPNSLSAEYKGGLESIDLILSPKDGVIQNVSKVLIAFDDSTKFYEALYGSNGTVLFLNKLVTPDYNEIVHKTGFIKMLKAGNKVSVRIEYNNGFKEDISFKLKGSTAAINEIIKFTREPSTNGEGIEGSIEEILIMAPKWGEARLYHRDITNNCEEYVRENFGKAYYFFTDKIKFDEETREIVYLRPNGEELIRIPEDVWSLNAYYDEGTLKQYDDDGNLIPFSETEK